MAGSTLKKPIRGRRMGVGADLKAQVNLDKRNVGDRLRPVNMLMMTSIYEHY